MYTFNLSGYFLFFEYLIYQSDQQFISKLNNEQYDESALMEVKIPLNLPYATYHADYERVDGELEHNGVYYNYVKRKVSNDTLYLVCLPNDKKTSLHSAASEYAKKVNDFPNQEKEGHSAAKKANVTSEYTQYFTTFEIASILPSQAAYDAIVDQQLIDTFIPDFFQPPRFLS